MVGMERINVDTLVSIVRGTSSFIGHGPFGTNDLVSWKGLCMRGGRGVETDWVS